MDQSPQPDLPQKQITIWIAALTAPVLVLLYLVLGFFDNSTEIYPSHDNVLNVVFLIAGLCALLFGTAGIILTKRSAAWRRIIVAFAFTVAGFIFVFLIADRMANLVEARIDFPPGATQTHQELIQISRAYQTHGKGRGWDIQTMPIWSDLKITQHDYNFMLAHRRPGDQSQNPDNISSNGYFCAKVTVQQSPDALRVLHAGTHKLPQGTVIICPSFNSNSSTK